MPNCLRDRAGPTNPEPELVRGSPVLPSPYREMELWFQVPRRTAPRHIEDRRGPVTTTNHGLIFHRTHLGKGIALVPLVKIRKFLTRDCATFATDF